MTVLRLREAFNNPQRVPLVVMKVTLTDATRLKTNTGEVNWLPTMGWFFDQVSESVDQHGGKVCKYLTSGLVATFPMDRAAETINAAILIQERISEAQRENTYQCNCSIGIATGKVVEFSNGLYTDYIGTCVDKSEGLADAANAGAIFVDTSTVSASNMMNVFSNYGTAAHREGGQYLSALEELPGFAERIAYHEIFWAAQLFGVRSRTVTGLTVSPSAPRPMVPESRSIRTEWLRGTVTRWHEERSSGFVQGGDGSTYYLHSDNVCVGVTVRPGDTVFYVAEPARGDGRNPRATCALPMGTEIIVTVGKVFSAYGFSQLSDGRGTRQELFLDLGPEAQKRFQPGQDVRVKVTQNPKGPAGVVVSPALNLATA